MLQSALKRPSFWVGLLVFAISWIVILMTNANTVSYWDCGEFAACSYTMGVPHPPGSPLFIMIGRLFTFLPFGEIAPRVTQFSSLSGAFTILLTFLIVLRLVRIYRGKEESLTDNIAVLGGSAIGALALSWSPSFWFNVVESEVYGVSLFLTVLVIWMVMKWMDNSETGENDHYLLLATYLNGFAITIHLLNLLTIPTLFLLIWYQRKRLSYLLLLGWALSLVIIDLPLDMGIPFWVKLLSVPVALGFYVYFKRNNDNESAIIPMVHLLTFLGFTLYALIMIRSQLNPMINENDPSTFARLKSYLSREQYGTDNMIVAMLKRRGPFWEYQIKKMYLRYFDWNFIGIARDIYSGEKEFANNGIWRYWGLPFFLGLFGAYHHFVKDRKRAFANLVLFVMTGLAIVLYVNQDDPQPRERDYSYTGSFFAFAVWIGIGAVGLIDTILGWIKNPKLSPAVAGITVAAMLLVVPGRMLAVNYHENDRKNNYVAWDYSHNILESCDKNAILFTNGDNDTFPLWYLQEVENVRRDVTVVNLSLVNTGWYIKQMRDKFKVPISFDDQFIDMYIDAVTEDALMVRYWPPNRRRVTINSPEGPMNWEVPAAFFIPTEQNQKDRAPNFLRVQDMMIIDIMRTNVNKDGTWKRPIYFAATVSNSSMAGLSNFSMMEGLSFRIYPRPRNMRINPEKMYQKMLVEFKNNYRHLGDPYVYYNENETRLLQNYRSCFLQLAFHYYEQIRTPDERKAVSNIPPSEWETRFNELPNREKTLYILDFMEKILPEEVIPLDAPELVLQMGKVFYELGRQDELEKRLKRLQSVENPTADHLLMLGAAYEQFLHRPDEAKKIFDRVIGVAPTADGLYNAGEILYRSGIDSVSARMFIDAVRKGGLSPDKMNRVGSYLVQMGMYTEAENILLPAYQANPEDGTMLGALIAVYERSNQPARVADLLEAWVAKHPGDNGAKQRLDDVNKQLGKTTGGTKKAAVKKSSGIGIKPASKKK